MGLLVLGGLVSLLNWLTLCFTWRTGQFRSAVPLVGALFLGAGMLLVPAVRPFAWLALLLDYGTLAFLYALPRLIKEFWNTSSFRILQTYTGQSHSKTVEIRLYRAGVCTLRQTFLRKKGETGLLQSGNIGTWLREGDRLVLMLQGGKAIFKTAPEAVSETLVLEQGFQVYEEGDLSLRDIGLTLRSR